MSSGSGPVSEGLAREVAAGRLEADASQREVAARLDRLSGELSSVRRSSWFSRRTESMPSLGMYLWGGVGRGKTRLMDLFYESLDFPQRERTHFYRFMRQVHAGLRAAPRRTEPLAVVAERIAAEVRVICLDEFFVTDIADAMILGGLLAALFERGVALVATSNLPPSELYRDGLQRQRFQPAIDLLERSLEVVHLDGATDYRLLRLAGGNTYWDSGARGASLEMRRLFDTLGHGAASGPTELIIGERPIRALDVRSGVVWFEFRELCATPRAAGDYIDLAHLFHTVFLSDIPVFDAESEDAARRFLILIDELYDRHVNLVASAAAPPDALYRGEKLQFEFRRVASRLAEMQSPAYLAGGHRP